MNDACIIFSLLYLALIITAGELSLESYRFIRRRYATLTAVYAEMSQLNNNLYTSRISLHYIFYIFTLSVK